MTILVKEKPIIAPIIPSNIWRISVDRFLDLVDAGAFTEDEHVELLEGFIVEKMTANPPHAHIVDILVALLIRMLPIHYLVGNQRPFLADDSVPEPDLMVYTGRKGQFFDEHPNASNVAFLIEVSDSTLADDQKRKKRIYARAGVREYWIVNIPESQIEVYTHPRNMTFKQIHIYSGSDKVPVMLNNQQIGAINISDIFSTHSPT